MLLLSAINGTHLEEDEEGEEVMKDVSWEHLDEGEGEVMKEVSWEHLEGEGEAIFSMKEVSWAHLEEDEVNELPSAHLEEDEEAIFSEEGEGDEEEGHIFSMKGMGEGEEGGDEFEERMLWKRMIKFFKPNTKPSSSSPSLVFLLTPWAKSTMRISTEGHCTSSPS